MRDERVEAIARGRDAGPGARLDVLVEMGAKERGKSEKHTYTQGMRRREGGREVRGRGGNNMNEEGPLFDEIPGN